MRAEADDDGDREHRRSAGPPACTASRGNACRPARRRPPPSSTRIRGVTRRIPAEPAASTSGWSGRGRPEARLLRDVHPGVRDREPAKQREPPSGGGVSHQQHERGEEQRTAPATGSAPRRAAPSRGSVSQPRSCSAFDQRTAGDGRRPSARSPGSIARSGSRKKTKLPTAATASSVVSSSPSSPGVRRSHTKRAGRARPDGHAPTPPAADREAPARACALSAPPNQVRPAVCGPRRLAQPLDPRTRSRRRARSRSPARAGPSRRSPGPCRSECQKTKPSSANTV